MRRLFSFIDKNVDRVGYWAGFFIVVTGIWAWLVKHSSWVPDMNWADAAMIGIAATTVIIFVLSLAALAFRFARPAPQVAPASSPLATREELEASRYSPSPWSDAPDIQAYYELVDFTISKLLPACDALSTLLATMAEQMSADSTAKRVLLNFGFQSFPPQFWANRGKLERDINQSEPTLKFADLMHCIREMEMGPYHDVVLQTEIVRDAANTSFADSPAAFGAWREWAEAHNAMLDAYEKIRNDIRFKRVTGSGKRSLFAPRKEVNWGPRVDLASP